jgi:5-methylcytosine-specific restriction endonuclease McrA
MTDDFYSSDVWKSATPEQRKNFISRVRANQRMERERLLAEDRKKRKEAKAAAAPAVVPSARVSKAQRKAALAIKRQHRRYDKATKPIKKRNPADGVDVTSDAFLSTYAWRKLRMEALKKYGPRCQCCGATPADGAVMNVDHIKPRKKWPSLALDLNNLQVLCHDCNHGKGNWDETDWRSAAS